MEVPYLPEQPVGADDFATCRAKRRLLRNKVRVFNPERFSVGYLHVIYIFVIPERLENSICKAKNHDVLYGLFA